MRWLHIARQAGKQKLDLFVKNICYTTVIEIILGNILIRHFFYFRCSYSYRINRARWREDAQERTKIIISIYDVYKVILMRFRFGVLNFQLHVCANNRKLKHNKFPYLLFPFRKFKSLNLLIATALFKTFIYFLMHFLSLLCTFLYVSCSTTTTTGREGRKKISTNLFVCVNNFSTHIDIKSLISDVASNHSFLNY